MIETTHTMIDDAARLLEHHGFRAVSDQVLECKREIPCVPLTPRPEERPSLKSQREGIAKELREIAKSGAMIHLLGWDDIQRTCDYAAELLAPSPTPQLMPKDGK